MQEIYRGSTILSPFPCIDQIFLYALCNLFLTQCVDISWGIPRIRQNLSSPIFFLIMPIQIDKFTRSKRKTIALIIERDGTLTIRAPMRTSRATIDAFIQQKEDWILRTREKLKMIVPDPIRQYVDGEIFPVLGSSFSLKLVGPQRPALKFDNGFTLSQNVQHKSAQYFLKWYKQQAYNVISKRVMEYAQRHQFSPKQVKISSARTRWGSCSPDGTLNFTWRLVMAPLEVIDYVVIHELAHLRVKNHSSKFWDVVKAIDPQYKEKRKWLRENGGKLNL